jgi:hypothetical protein
MTTPRAPCHHVPAGRRLASPYRPSRRPLRRAGEDWWRCYAHDLLFGARGAGKLIQTATGWQRNGSSTAPRRATMTRRDPGASGLRSAQRQVTQGGSISWSGCGSRRHEAIRDDGYDRASPPMHSSPSRVCSTSGV